VGKVPRRYRLILQMAVGLRSPRVIGAIALLLAASAAWAVRALEVQVLRSTGGLAPEVVCLFREPAACQTLVDGSYLVFDRACHRVYRVPPSDSEAGNIIIPCAFALAGTASSSRMHPANGNRCSCSDSMAVCCPASHCPAGPLRLLPRAA